jgi:hypothetical protein
MKRRVFAEVDRMHNARCKNACRLSEKMAFISHFRLATPLADIY